MNLRQQIVQERVEQIATSFPGMTEDQAFLRLAHSVITGQSLYSFDESDIVDGSHDKQIDVITIDQDGDEATIYILQTKNTTSFSSNALIQMRNGLDWLQNRSRSEVNELPNFRFKDKILAFRSIRSGLGPSNLHLVVAFVTNGISSETSHEYNQEARAIMAQYNTDTYGSFAFQTWGCDELVNRINETEKKNRKITTEIRIRYDANNPSLIKYHAEGLKGIVCTTTASEIARIVNQDTTGSIFDANIRRFLGSRGAVNSDIRRACTYPQSSYEFWFLNNGITIVCDQFDPVTDPDNPYVKVIGMQIVNGCQTATTLALAARDGVLAPDVRVLLRIYETTNLDLVDKIVQTTNNQNKIGARDLKANDQVQVDMEQGFAKYGYFYERKMRQYEQASVDSNFVVVNEEVGQSYLAIVMRKPSDARRRKYKVWGDEYDRIFGGQMIEPHVLTTLIYRSAKRWLHDSIYMNDPDDVRRKLANNGAFHVARITSYLWRGTDSWASQQPEFRKQIQDLQSEPNLLNAYFEKAFLQLETVVRSKPQYYTDLDSALKSIALDIDIDKSLHRSDRNAVGAPTLWDMEE